VAVKLEQNYRSTGQILKAANAIIARNTERRDKRLFTEATAGDAIISFEGETERDEAEFVAATIGSALGEAAIPATSPCSTGPTASRACWKRPCAGATSLRRRGRHAVLRPAEIKDLIAYLRVIQNPPTTSGCCGS
jgi:DNA helicase-2/ATP-dependent DNA helicase PcrA